MKSRSIAGAAAIGVIGALALADSVASGAEANNGDGGGFQPTSVPANPKAAGVTSPNVLAPELVEQVAAQGSMKLENGTADLPYYGYRGDGPLMPGPGDLPSATHKVE